MKQNPPPPPEGGDGVGVGVGVGEGCSPVVLMATFERSDQFETSSAVFKAK